MGKTMQDLPIINEAHIDFIALAIISPAPWPFLKPA